MKNLKRAILDLLYLREPKELSIEEFVEIHIPEQLRNSERTINEVTKAFKSLENAKVIKKCVGIGKYELR